MANAVLPALGVIFALAGVFGEPVVYLLKGQPMAVGLFQGSVDEFRVGFCTIIPLALVTQAGSRRVAVSNGVRGSGTHAVNGY